MSNVNSPTQISESMPESTDAKTIPPRDPANYFSELSVRFGVFAGLIGSVVIIAIITGLTLGSGQDIWLSPRVIASVFLGEGAFTGILPIILGTIVHFISGAVYGAVFAYIVPRLPRGFWVVAGLLYGLIIWGIASIVLRPFIQPINISSIAYFTVLLFSHIVFGLILGTAGSLHGYRDSGPEQA